MMDLEALRMTQRVPQGSVLGPTLWNILYDSVFGPELPRGCINVVCGYDVALVVKSRDHYMLMGTGEMKYGW